MTFEPIAIVGQGCVLPGASSPEALFQAVIEGRSAIRNAPSGRLRMSSAHALGTPGRSIDRCWTDAGGYVEGFEEAFDPSGFVIGAAEVRALDPAVLWVLHAARQALPSFAALPSAARARTGLILGNLSFPTASMSRFAEQIWLDAQGPTFLGGKARALLGLEAPDARARFMSGLPAFLAATALGLGGATFALDAACASSLYAIKLACDELHDRRADCMLAGAVNAADPLFLHIGFAALSALSTSGQSRPFHRDADGLLPAEGAALVALKRLADARRDGDRVLGVIRGVGLSNDGRGRGLLAPAEEGQVRAMRAAYAQAGLSPASVSLVECHATGTPVGDGTEVRSMATLFEGLRSVPIGSLKGNLGHLITAAGVAGLIKILGAFRAGQRPPTLHAGAPIEALAGSPFRLLAGAEPWPSEGPRVAAVSAFGFGGNNAHLLVSEDDPAAPSAATSSAKSFELKASPAPLAVVGLALRLGEAPTTAAAARALVAGTPLGGTPLAARASEVSVALDGLRFPPRDLEQTLPQQLLVLEAAREAARGLSLPRDRTSVLVGMGADPEVARYGARFRMADWADRWAGSLGMAASPAWVREARDAVIEALEAPGVVGTMPNIPANRVNSQLDLAGPSFTVSAEQGSGLRALAIAARALRAGEIDAALVGAADLSDEPVHRAALAALGLPDKPADAAVALVLERLDDARRHGHRVIALLDGDAEPTLLLGDGEDARDPFPQGVPHAAAGLLHVAAAAFCLHHGARPEPARGAVPWLGPRSVETRTRVLDGSTLRARLTSTEPPAPLLFEPAPALHVWSGADRAAILRALAEGRAASEGRAANEGPARLVIVATGEAELATRRDLARRALEKGGPLPEGISFHEAPIGGDLAFVFTGAAASYQGMGRELALALPDQVTRLAARFRSLPGATAWVFGPPAPPPHPLDQLWASAFLCQLHAEISRTLLGLTPQATIGYSSGESNALFAMGVWTDLDAMVAESWASPVFTRDIVGDFQAIRRAFRKLGSDGPWKAFSVSAPLAAVREALRGEPSAHLTIVNTVDDVVIGGEASACERVIARLGRERALPLDYEMAAHCPEIEEIHGPWYDLHHRATTPIAHLRIYSAGSPQAFVPSAEAAAAAITAQALSTLDYPKMIEQAYADGVRVFLEHGPRGLCTGWIKRILGDRPHLAISLDVAGRSGVRQLANAAAALLAAGLPVDVDALARALAKGAEDPVRPGAHLKRPAHPPALTLPPLEAHMQAMPPAPRLVPVLDADVLHAAAPAPLPIPAPRPAPAPMAIPHVPAQPAPAPLAPAHSPVAMASASTHAPSIAGAPAEILARATEQLTRLGAIHRDFLEAQGKAHRDFLAMQQRMLGGLVGGYASSLQAPALAAPLPAPALPAFVVTPPPAPVIAKPAASMPVASTPVASMPVVSTPVASMPVASTPVATPRPSSSPVSKAAKAPLPGPKFDRAALEILASGKISSIFGPAFADQDGFARQVRMPMPPLLLADRVTGIDAVPHQLGTGTLWTETDVTEQSAYLHEGRMPAGIMIESGQADLLLISWQGIDRLNRGERVYRLLGCELTYHGELPQPGDTLRYEIHVDGHANQGDVRLFFFHYDCHVEGQLRLSVRGGQAGFFTDRELDESGGILWDAETAKPSPSAVLDPPARACTKACFDEQALRAFTEGRVLDCFGPGFELALSHVRTPRIQGGDMLFLREVSAFDPQGGPWGRGYLRAEAPITPDDWYFKGHFHNDPCMPGTLMFEGCVQAMSFYLAALGYTLERDGWRFEPVHGHTIPMRCRGQATPSSRHITYEVFVEEVIAGPEPTLYADLLCTVDGLKAFHARRVGLELVPAWPLDEWRRLPIASASDPAHVEMKLATLGGLRGWVEPKPVASHEGFPFDYPSLLACAWGRPSAAFGAMYSLFDGPRKVARLPGPPYHFMSRITFTDAPQGTFRPGVTIEAEYDIPEEAWYFGQNGHPTMPFCVLMEAALQPCGWLASYIGSSLTTEIDLLFRNLDGTGTLLTELLPSAGTLRTRVKVTDISRSAGMIIESFEVACFLGETKAFEMKTVFGYFPKEAFENQVGLPVSPEDRARIEAPSSFLVDLTERPARYVDGAPRLPLPMLCMLDRVTAWEPEGGKKGLGWARAEKDVDPGEWFFKAHFYQDPVQPGSLGIEALIELLQFAMIERGMGEGIANARFEPVALGKPSVWKYRGQVVPKNERITTEIEILEVGEDERGRLATASGSLWVDGKRIYHAPKLSMRIVPGGSGPRPSPKRDEERLDPAVDTWLGDHRPTWTLPALPMMSMVDRLASAPTLAPGEKVVELCDVQVKRWLPFPGGPVRLCRELQPSDEGSLVTLSAFREARDPALSRFEPVATGRVRLASRYPAPPAPFAPLGDAAPVGDPYQSAALFHGPSFQLLRSLRMGRSGASALVELRSQGVPRGALHQGLLDALTHAIPHDELGRWSDDIPPDQVGYPYRIPSIRFFGELPSEGEGQVEVRFAGFDGEARFPKFELQLLVVGAVRVALTLVEILLPRGPIGRASRLDRRAFLRDRRFVPGVRLSRALGPTTVASPEDVKPSDWLPGNVATIYGVAPGADLITEVALRDHLASRAFVHPQSILLAEDQRSATVAMRPLRRHFVAIERESGEVRVRDAAPPAMDLSPVEDHWRRFFGIGSWPVEDLYYGLIERFVGDVVLSDPEAFSRVHGKSCLFLGNHQVAVESLLFSVIVSALSGVSTVTLAKAEHRGSWVGELIRHSFSYPGVSDPGLITFFDREDRESLMRIIGELGQEMASRGKSAMVHVEGTRSLSCRAPVVKMSSAFLDMALAVGVPIVPVRFVGGLPVDELAQRIELPLGYGRQDIWIGRPLFPEELRSLPLKERKQVVLDAINGLGPGPAREAPSAPDPAFGARVEQWMARAGMTPEKAALAATLEALPLLRSEATGRLVSALREGRALGGDEPREQWLEGFRRWLGG